MKNHNNLLLILVLLIMLSMTIIYFSPSILSGAKTLNDNSNTLTNQTKNIELEEVIVKNGDTLWDLARQYYDSKTDLRKVIHEIKDINDLTNSNLKPGQKIKIPLG